MSEDKAVLIKTAYSYYQKGDWDRAIEEYHKLAILDPKDLNVHNMLADIYAKKGDIPEALQQYDLVAQGFDQKNQVDKVLQVYKRMLRLVPNDPDLVTAVKNLVDKYLDRASKAEEEEPEKAIEIYRSILKAEPSRLDANFQYSKLLMKKGQKFEAIETLMNLASVLDPATQTGRLAEVLQMIVDFDPMNIEARENLADLLIQARQTEAAIKNLQDLIELYIRKNDFNKAEEIARKTIELGDQNTYYHLGVIYFNQQKYNESKGAFEKFLTQQEAHVGALKYLALVFIRLNQNQQAVQIYLRILDVYFNENLLDEAREVRQTILDLDPQNTTVMQYPLSQNLIPPEPVIEETSLPEAPQENLDTELEEQEIQDYFLQAQSYSEKGLYEQAIDLYLDMLKRWPQLPDIRTRLQQVYALMARSVEPVEKYPSPEEIKTELEKELREQMRRELEEQARQTKEIQNEMDRKREMDQMRLKQELESKLLEQVHRSKEDELRIQITREFEEKQRLLALEKEKLEKETAQSYELLKAELEETKASLESKIREQIEREMKEKAEKEAQRDSQIRAAMQEEELKRQQYDLQKKEQEAAKAKINQEIHQGMERLRMEKEKESKIQPTVISAQPPEGVEKETPKNTSPSKEVLDDPFIRQTLADIYAKQGLYMEALKIYERILNDEPDNHDVKEKLRDILRMKGI